MEHLKISLITACLLLAVQAFAQEDKGYVYETFKETRIVNGHSAETTGEGDLNLIIAHRFGTLNGGVYEWFGLDDATMRIGLDYGVSKNFTLGLGRSTFEKTYDGYAKFRVLHQNNRNPISLTAFASTAINTIRFNEDEQEYKRFKHRLFYTAQLLIARKFSDRFSLQLMPSWVHRNLVATSAEKNNVFSLGAATRIQITKTIGLNLEYYYVPDDQLRAETFNSFSVGFDIETNGHTFQLHFTNSQGMIEKFFIAETTGDWLDQGVHFGFNISRVFRVKAKKQ
ncbi:MAG: DUF5777 family beta-barrel protein [Flammeovirgaceae bacterium]